MIKEIKKMRILKEFDDYVNSLRSVQAFTSRVTYYDKLTFIYMVDNYYREIDISIHGMNLSKSLYLSNTEIKKYFKNKYSGYKIEITKL